MNPKVVAGIGIALLAFLSLPLVLSSKVTMAKYKEVEMGMSYEQVKGILGAGKTIDEAKPPDMKDLPPGMPKPDMKQAKRMLDSMGLTVYVWEKGDDKAISVMLRDGKVIGKTQVGLADQPSQEFDRNALPGMPGMPGPGGPMPGMPPMR